LLPSLLEKERGIKGVRLINNLLWEITEVASTLFEKHKTDSV
jgi:hypothetical protein